MRKEQKKQVEEFLNVLSEMHTEIKKQVQKNERIKILELLEQCQQGAIQLGNLIESLESDDFITVHYLEEYCEILYGIYEEFEHSRIENQTVEAGQIYEMLNYHQLRIESSVKNDIALRREAVFLPYKASMWDSMESIWLAADEDPDCDTYVIPIPYYDRNPDGTFREMHYEGDQYPAYVPVIEYETYDFEKRRPDMIFIHNPYDNCNYVTSVPPFFYSNNLKRFTDCLVYIPYFILGEVDRDNEQAVKGMEHFCTVPGVINADKVIVQSEKMRQVYIDVLTRYVGKDTKQYWKKKILGLGSPKVDKIRNTKREELELPKEWISIIQKANGEWKKIILYNTSVAGLLQYDRNMLEKIGDVFSIFQKDENREKIVLLWRPHPLIKATIKSMRPHLWMEYRKLVKEFKEEKWGIYDDSPDLNRAIAVCDAYYGDYSSLVQLCQYACKPVMIQNVVLSRKNGNVEESIYGGRK